MRCNVAKVLFAICLLQGSLKSSALSLRYSDIAANVNSQTFLDAVVNKTTSESQLGPFGGGQCATFYKTIVGPKTGWWKQKSLRQNNVNQMTRKFPWIGKLDVLTWTDHWPLVKKMLKELGLKVNIGRLNAAVHKGPSKAAQGKIAHWASLLLAFAWQVRFNHKCMTLLEDDVRLPDNFGAVFSRLNFKWPASKPQVLQFAKWGEGWVFNLPAAKRFLNLVCDRGIYMANDNFIMDNFDVRRINVGITKLVEPNAGNINGSPLATMSEFMYPKKPPAVSYTKLVSAFGVTDRKGLPEIDLPLVARRIVYGEKKLNASQNNAE